MYFKYGNYTHALDEVGLRIRKEALKNDDDVPYGVRTVWSLTGFLQADTQAALITAINQLESAYSKHGQNAYLLLNDGSTVMHSLLTASSTGGVRVVVPPSYPEYEGGEGGTYRSYSIELEAEFGINQTGASGAIVTWEETISFQGGGPRYVHLELRNGPPQKQLVSEQTPFRMTQSGSAVGYLTWPPFPGPIWPQAENYHERRRDYGTPGKNNREFPISWSYSFTSASAVNGRPTRRPF